MRAQGLQLPEGTLNVVVRAGGWNAVSGVFTVMKTYARKVIDEHIDLYSINLGYDIGPEGCAERLREYLGEPAFPKHPVVEPGRIQLFLQVRLHAWRLFFGNFLTHRGQKSH